MNAAGPLDQDGHRPAQPRLPGPRRLDHGGRRPRRGARQDAARDRPAQEHGDHVRLRQRLAAGSASDPRRQVPALRGVAAGAADHSRPGHPEGGDGARPGLQHRLRADAGRLRERDGRPDDGRPLAAADDEEPEQRPDRALGIEALAAAVRRGDPGQRLGPSLHRACAPTATRTSSTARPATRSSSTARRTRTSSTTSPATPATRTSRTELDREDERSSPTAPARPARRSSPRHGTG